MAITAQLVKELRDMTAAGMMDCKKALVEVEGDLEKAVDWLRQKGMAKAAKKSGRATSEGLVTVAATADNMVPQFLKMTHLVHNNRMPEVQVRSGGVKAHLDAQRLAARYLFAQFVLVNQLGHA